MTEKRGITGYLVVVLVLVLGIIAGYYIGSWQHQKEVISMPVKKRIAPVLKKKKVTPSGKEVLPEPEKKEQVFTQENVSKENDCERIEREINELFNYLDNRDYIRHLRLGMGCFEYFKLMLSKLTANPPVPAGEGVEAKLMISNIYYFYRVLSKTDIRLVKEILQNESDGIEIYLGLLYRWLNSREKCGDPQKIKPPFETIYRFAGFFLNTLGGRSYLYRRAPRVRLVVSYYCALIIHRADQLGKNSYGIDLFPILTSLYNEIDSREDIQFREEYLTRLSMIQNYYLTHR